MEIAGAVGKFLAALWDAVKTIFTYRAGQNSVKAKTAEKVVEQVKKTNRPVTDPERERVRKRYKRD